MVAVALYVFVDTGRVHLLFPGLGVLRLAFLSAAAALVLCLLGRSLHALATLRHPATWLLLGLAVWACLSVPGSLYAGGSVRFLIGDYFKVLLMALVCALSVRGPRDVERLLLAFFAAAVLYAVVVLMRFRLGIGERLSEMYTYDANDLALLLVCAVPFTLHLLLHSKNLVRRALTVVALACITVVIVRTGSRGGFLALVVVLALVLIVWRSVRLRWRVTAAVGAAGVLLVSSNVGYWRFVSSIANPADDYNMTSPTGRVAVWKRGIGYMWQYPVFGVGVDAFPSAEGRISELARDLPPGRGLKWSTAHNSFVQIGAELGIPGLLLFCAFLWHITLLAYRLSRPGTGPYRALAPPGPALAGLLVPTLGGFITAAFFLSQAYASLLYFLAALVLALQRFARVPRSVRATAQQRRHV
jgi:O-antigen ligase